MSRLVRVVTITAVIGVLAAVTSACSHESKKATKAPPKRATTTTEMTTTTVAAPVAFAPLTGLGVDAEGALRLIRPALAVKIDNSPQAMPQAGLNRADLVVEIKVEGISRLMSVTHSNDVDEIGPVRSARLSDPDILALLGRPLFGWSGANDGVKSAVRSRPWIVNVNWDAVNRGAYRRRSDRPAPHNLYTSSKALYAYAQPDQLTATPVFGFLGTGESLVGGVAAPGVRLNVGTTPSAWVWDPDRHWMRSQYGRQHDSEGDGQVTATSVVIMEIRYSGGSKAPVAQTTGSGPVIVLANGTAIAGTWSRGSVSEPLVLTAAAGQPIRLQPGRIWLELTSGATAQILSESEAAALPKSSAAR